MCEVLPQGRSEPFCCSAYRENCGDRCFAFCTFYLVKFGMGLQTKLVKSSISLLEVCIALGSEEFFGGEKVCSKGRV